MNAALRRCAGDVEVVGLAKRFGGAAVLDNISFEAKRGEFLALLGPSGSGKTTTLMIIAGFEAANAGEVRLDGRNISDVPPHRRDFGVVFQNYALFPHLSVSENLAFPLKMRGVARGDIAHKITSVLDLVSLGGFADRYPGQLSGGQQQRVALARALVFDPPVILMDEPLGALDKHLRERMQIEIKQIQQQLGTTVIYVTHDQNEAITMADRIAVMNGGRIEQIGSPSDIYNRPDTLFVARFLGESNAIGAVVVDSGPGSSAVIDIGGTQLRIRQADPLIPGTRVTAILRPQHIAFASTNTEDNPLDGIVEDSVFAGDREKLRILLEREALTLVADRIIRGGRALAMRNDPVRIFINPENVHIVRQAKEPMSGISDAN
jgi:putative spermidine/putrescine transport system ATP-binding protein